MSTSDCRVQGATIAAAWSLWLVYRRWGCCAGCCAIIVSQMNLDSARRIAAGEFMTS